MPLKITFSLPVSRSIAVWNFKSPWEVDIRRVLVGHRAAVNVVDFDDRYIVSASGDRSIKVWDTETCKFLSCWEKFSRVFLRMRNFEFTKINNREISKIFSGKVFRKWRGVGEFK